MMTGFVLTTDMRDRYALGVFRAESLNALLSTLDHAGRRSLRDSLFRQGPEPTTVYFDLPITGGMFPSTKDGVGTTGMADRIRFEFTPDEVRFAFAALFGQS